MKKNEEKGQGLRKEDIFLKKLGKSERLWKKKLNMPIS